MPTTDGDGQTRRTVLSGAATSTALMASIAGCTGSFGGGKSNDGGAGGSDGSGKVKFWSSTNKQELTFHQNAAKAFRESNSTGLKIRPVPEGESSEQVVLSALSSGTAPGVFANVFPGFAAKLEKNGAVANLYELDGAKKFMKERSGQKILSRYESPDNGGMYQAPWKANPVLFQYNDTVFEESGYEADDYPQTLSGLIEAGKKITNQKSVEYLWDRAPKPTWYERWFDFLPLYLSATKGGDMIEATSDGKLKPAFNNDAAAKVLSFFQDLYDNDLAPSQSTKKQLFAKDKAAINTGGPWVIPFFKETNENISMSHRKPPVPDGMSLNGHTYADPKNTSIFKSANNKQGAWKFVSFEQQKKWDTKFLERSLQLPLRKDLVDVASGFFEKNPGVEKYAKVLETSHPPAYTPNYTKYMNTFSEQAFVPVCRGNKQPKKALNDAEQALKGVLN